MRSSFATGAGIPLERTPSIRQQAARRRWAVAAAIVGLAGLAAVFGAVTTPRTAVEPEGAGAFSYFPSE
jgi:hypothetical protein